MFVQPKGVFVRHIEMKKGHPKSGKNTRLTWAKSVLRKLEAETGLEYARLNINATIRSRENQY